MRNTLGVWDGQPERMPSTEPEASDMLALLIEKERQCLTLQREREASKQLVEWLRGRLAMREAAEYQLAQQLAEQRQVEQHLQIEIQGLRRVGAWHLGKGCLRVRRWMAPVGGRRHRLLQLMRRALGVWYREGMIPVVRKTTRKILGKTLRKIPPLHRLVRRCRNGWREHGFRSLINPRLLFRQKPCTWERLSLALVSGDTDVAAENADSEQVPVLSEKAPTHLSLLSEVLSHAPRHWNSDVVAVDVIVPIYRGLEETLLCINSLLEATVSTPHEIIVINDASPDPVLVDCLRQVNERGLITLVDNPHNLGFVRTVNRGMALHPERDVLLLNSDTEVYGDWLDRIYRAAYRDQKTGTVTPLSNNATICSYPFFCEDNIIPTDITPVELDRLCSELNEQAYVDIPTGVGYCMYIRRACLNQVGLFDEYHFGRGYGEENDFCLRAQALGWRDILTTDTFVYHSGSASFGAEKGEITPRALQVMAALHPDYQVRVSVHVATNPALPYRRRLDLARLGERQRTILFITHQMGGGTECHVVDLASRLEQEGIRVVILRPNGAGSVRLERLCVQNTPNLVFTLPDEFWSLHETLRWLGVEHAHVQHTLGVPELVLELLEMLHLRYDWTLHDYYSICPRIHLIDEHENYCGEPNEAGCNDCLTRNGGIGNQQTDIGSWRQQYSAWMTRARRIIVPNEDVAQRLKRYYPHLRCTVRPHLPRQVGRPVAVALTEEPLRVAILGAIGLHKGSAVLLACAQDGLERKLPIQFHLVGNADPVNHAALSLCSNVSITGPYAEEEVFDILKSLACHCAFFPSICPETFSYTLSIAFAAHLYPIAFDLGAQAERIRSAGVGEVLPLGMKPAEINDTFVRIADRLREGLHFPDVELACYPSIYTDYYNLGPMNKRVA